MRSKFEPHGSAEEHVCEIRRATRKQYNAEEKIRIVLEGLRGEYSIAELGRREGIAQSLYYKWSKTFLTGDKSFFSFPWEGSALAQEFSKSGEAKFIPITFQEHWAVIRKIDEANNVSYTCK